MGTIVLALLSGALSTLSPCVLPLLPIVLGAALTEHKFGPAALAAGVAVSFVTIGLFVATIGFSLGVGQDIFRLVAASLMIAIGAVLLLPRLQGPLAVAAGPFGNWAQAQAGDFSRAGLTGQFLLGLLLGAVWSPCVGPTLGAASVLAAQGKDLGQVAMTMFAFGIGTAAPLLLLGLLVARGAAALARPADVGGQDRQDSAWPPARGRRADDRHRPRQDGGDGSGQRLAGLAHHPDDAILTRVKIRHAFRDRALR